MGRDSIAGAMRSNTSGSVYLVSVVESVLRGFAKPGARLIVGLSGGVDSVVLLDILQRLARKRRFQIAAFHVNHQVSPNALAWERFCRRLCRERAIPFRSKRVRLARGKGLEAEARAVRYAALLSQPADGVVLAHHQDDQAETVLLQLLRGAGVKGLAAMPRIRIGERGSRPLNSRSSPLAPRTSLPRPALLRPLLDVSRLEIFEYARSRGLEWIEDESNRDIRRARNFVRHELLPALARRFPSCRLTLARSARHLAEAAQLLDELAEIDAAGATRDGMLAVAVLRALTPVRARNVLRWFLHCCGVTVPGAARLEEVLRQLVTAQGDTRVQIELDQYRLYRWGGFVHVVARTHPPVPVERRWRSGERLALPELGGVLHMAAGRGTGIDRARLAAGTVLVRGRSGGERLQPDCARPRRALSNLFQELRIPPWQRDRLPLIYCDDHLVWVAGLGVDCAWQARAQEASIVPRWVPQPAA